MVLQMMASDNLFSGRKVLLLHGGNIRPKWGWDWPICRYYSCGNYIYRSIETVSAFPCLYGSEQLALLCLESFRRGNVPSVLPGMFTPLYNIYIRCPLIMSIPPLVENLNHRPIFGRSFKQTTILATVSGLDCIFPIL